MFMSLCLFDFNVDWLIHSKVIKMGEVSKKYQLEGRYPEYTPTKPACSDLHNKNMINMRVPWRGSTTFEH